MLALALILLSQVTPDSRVSRVERVPGGRMEGGRGGVKGWAFFEAFPVGGAGTTTACSTTAPTGAKGETLTFTRASSATCTKTATGGLATTGIANGDLVVLSANQPRVEYDSAGTLGLLVESARTNSLVRSESIDNAVWTKAAGATVTADYAVAPDGTTTADRLVYDATSSYVYQVYSTGGTTTTASVFLRGTSSSGSIDICRGGGVGQCAVCSYVADSWSRCVFTSAFASSSNVFIGCDAPTKGAACSAAGDVLVWGFQGETGAYATSYIPTTSAAVTRSADSPPVASVTPSTVATGCMSLRVELFTTATNGLMAADATGAWKQGLVTFGGQRAYIGAVSMVGPLVALTAGAHTASMRWDGSGTTMVLDGSPTVGAAGTPVATNQIIIGGYNGGNLEPGLYSRIQYDTSPTRCTP